jgi:hypothetical protein
MMKQVGEAIADAIGVQQASIFVLDSHLYGNEIIFAQGR